VILRNLQFKTKPLELEISENLLNFPECGQSENNCQNLNTKNSEKFSEFLGYETKFLRN
jgi:hypothetical protein